MEINKPKIITPQEIQVLLSEFYQTNISAQKFDAVKQFFFKLPDVEEPKL